MIYVIGAVAIAYQLLALAASLWRLRTRTLTSGWTPTVSVLKPVRGGSAGFEQAIISNAAQQYPRFELLFGFSLKDDPAREPVRRLAEKFDHVRVVESATQAPNGKAGTLIDLARAAQGEVIVISDADILVPEQYLARVVAPLEAPEVGLVTCAYRARSETFAGRFEALGVSTDFAPSTMLAPFAGVDEFALGSTIAVRRADLERIGGFEAVAGYLADDYQIGHRIHGLGLKCVLSEVVVDTNLAGASWAGVWDHQVRWARTVRVSRFGGYLGLPATFATLWALLAAALGHGGLAAAILTTRLLMAVGAGWGVLSSPDALKLAWLIPARDLYGVAVWVAGLFGNTAEWGGQRLTLDREGRIVS